MYLLVIGLKFHSMWILLSISYNLLCIPQVILAIAILTPRLLLVLVTDNSLSQLCSLCRLIGISERRPDYWSISPFSTQTFKKFEGVTGCSSRCANLGWIKLWVESLLINICTLILAIVLCNRNVLELDYPINALKLFFGISEVTNAFSIWVSGYSSYSRPSFTIVRTNNFDLQVWLQCIYHYN